MRAAAAGVLLLASALALRGPAPAASGPPGNGIVSASTGAGLFAANCSSCHGPAGEGVPPPGRPGAGGIRGIGPSLRSAGALAADFYLRTGYMPLRSARKQPQRSRVLFSENQVELLVAYVAGLGDGPPVPSPKPEQASVARGLELFTEHCAGCHQIAAEGGYVTGARVPALTEATDRQIAEAVRLGPYVMPSFSARAIPDGELNAIIRYVDYAKHPDDRGGWALGHLGPVPEGMVGWLIATFALVAMCVLLGRRLGR